MDTDKLAVKVRDAYKSYDGKTYVLKGLNMHVKQGTIYGLLGSSGCGKSTILNSIIGLVGLNSGTIELSVKSKHDVGFMPQAVCLYDQLTVEEILNYYSTMYGMSSSQRRSRIELMYDILDLPDRYKCTPELSGGQKRRVSLAVALIHDPELIILDEPTVGVDPVLRQRIWEFLTKWCEDGGKTIIITTHYIEETKQAHTVGLMREGIMLKEKSPISLMEACNTQFLEDAFLKLSQQQKTVENTKSIIYNKQLTYSPISHTKQTFAKPRFTAEVKKNLIYLWRNISVALFIFGLPSMCILLFYFGNGRDPEGLSLAVVNNDVISCDNYKHLSHICDLNYLSCNYLKHLTEKKVILVDYKEVEVAIDHVKNTDIWGVLYFTADFTNALAMRVNEPLLIEEQLVDNTTITVYMDYSNKIIYELLSRKLRNSYLDMMKEIYSACDLPINFLNLPIKFEKPIYGRAYPSFREFVAPALITLLMFGMPLTYGIIIVIEEKNSGATSRSLVAGTSLFEVLAAHTLVQIGVQLVQTVSSMVMMYWILEFPLERPCLSTLLLILQGLAGTAFAFTLSTSFSSISGVSCLCTGCILACIMLGGMMWPTEAIHPSIKLLSWIAPNSFATQSLRSLTLRGWDLTYKDVYLGFISCTAWIIVFTSITYFYVKRNKAKSFLSKHM